jgi:hypothetical protein
MPMPALPSEYLTLILAFAPIFSKRIWNHVLVLLVGAILTPNQRTVTAALRIMGPSRDKHFQNYHRVLNRAVWSSREVSRVLLNLLVTTFALLGPVILACFSNFNNRIETSAPFVVEYGIGQETMLKELSHALYHKLARVTSSGLAVLVSRSPGSGLQREPAGRSFRDGGRALRGRVGQSPRRSCDARPRSPPAVSVVGESPRTLAADRIRPLAA